jgi:hypothetical protein
MMAGMGRKSGRVVPVVLVVGAVVLAGVMALGLGLAGSANAGSHSFDPSDDANFNTYELVNDAKRDVTVYLCTDATCSALNPAASWIPLAPGASTVQQEYWDPGISYGFMVATSPHARECLVVRADSKASGTVRIPLSTATPCPAKTGLRPSN